MSIAIMFIIRGLLFVDRVSINSSQSAVPVYPRFLPGFSPDVNLKATEAFLLGSVKLISANLVFPSKGEYAIREPMSKFHTTESAAEYLGVTASRIRQLILGHRLKSEKHGRDHLIQESALQEYLTQGKRKPGRKPNK